MSQDEELDIPLSECCTRLSTDEQKQSCTCNNVLICLYKCGGVGALAFVANLFPPEYVSTTCPFTSGEIWFTKVAFEEVPRWCSWLARR